MLKTRQKLYTKPFNKYNFRFKAGIATELRAISGTQTICVLCSKWEKKWTIHSVEYRRWPLIEIQLIHVKWKSMNLHETNNSLLRQILPNINWITQLNRSIEQEMKTKIVFASYIHFTYPCFHLRHDLHFKANARPKMVTMLKYHAFCCCC